ncbi:hypothetical protein [Baekduia sp.]|jgi:hypothetical protein|uniref:hypothetical protein n=1 Tax=Baekduia sp. TaxID=2600305 RepID=UPI002DFF7847|nr:hypothetical protein [Baekduia sp.]
MSSGTKERGLKAAYGRRRSPLVNKVKTRVTWGLQQRALGKAEGQRFDYLEVVPPVGDDPTALADVSARINWYLSDRGVPVFMEGASGRTIAPEQAPYLDPELVRDPGWAATRPAGRPLRLVHRYTPKLVAEYLRAPASTRVIDPNFALVDEIAYFHLAQDLAGEDGLPDAATSSARLLARAKPGGSAFVLATGPSASMVDPEAVDTDLRVTCNSAVRDHELLEKLKPDVIAFSDRVFHFGPSRYAAAFRRDLRHAYEATDALIVTSRLWARPLLAHMPELAPRVVAIDHRQDVGWRWPTENDVRVKSTGNVLTNLMLPVAFALADRVEIAGCDGRNPDENYFWKHNAKTQYADDLMQAAFEAHPAFFADRDYGDYYDEHVVQLEELLATGERAQKTSTGVTPSHIPALLTRGAPRFEKATSG